MAQNTVAPEPEKTPEYITLFCVKCLADTPRDDYNVCLVCGILERFELRD